MKQSENNIVLVSKESVQFFVSMIKELDEPIYQQLCDAIIPLDINDNVCREYTYLPESCLKSVMEVLGESLDNDELGVCFWRACKETYIPKFVSQLTPGHDLKSVLDELAQRLRQESSSAKIYVQESGGSWWLVREKMGTDEAWFKYAEMFSVMFMCELLLALSGNAWRPTRIGIRSGSADGFTILPTLENVQFFTDRPVTAVEIPSSMLFAPVCIGLKPHRSTLPRGEISFDGMTFVEQFKIAIFPYLTVGKLPIKRAAKILRMHVRTLQRKLESENVIYKTLIEEMVFDQVRHHLAQSEASITAIANIFGYSDAAHFTRSFKRINGITPSQYRKQNYR